MRGFLVVVVVVAVAGCATMTDELAAGRLRAACDKQYDEPENEELLRTWLKDHIAWDARMIPAEEAAARLGGAVRGYGVDIGLVEIRPKPPATAGTEALHIETTLSTNAGAAELAARLPPLFVDDGPLLPPGPLEADMLAPAALPEPEPPVHRGGGGGGIIEGFANMFIGIGEAIGAVAMIPVGIVVGIVAGVGTAFDAILGSVSHGVSSASGYAEGGASTYAPPADGPVIVVYDKDGVRASSTGPAPAAPVIEVAKRPPPPKASPLDALLDQTAYDDLVAQRRTAYEAARAAVEAERDARRGRMAKLQGELGCRNGTCLVVMTPAGADADADLVVGEGDDRCYPPKVYAHVDAALHVEATHVDAAHVDALHVDAAHTDAAHVDAAHVDAAHVDAAHVDAAHVDAAPARTGATATAPAPLASAAPATAAIALDAGAPAWAFRTPQVIASLPAPKAGDGAAASAALLCELKWRRAVKDVDGTAPDVVVRVTAGHDVPRGQLVALGEVKKSARFLVPSVSLVAGERLRISAASSGDGASRSLGGAVVDYDGPLPLELKSALFTATCAPAPADVVDKTATAARVEVDKAVDALTALATSTTTSTARASAKARLQARSALVALAAARGWSDDDVTAALARLRAADPAERVANP